MCFFVGPLQTRCNLLKVAYCVDWLYFFFLSNHLILTYINLRYTLKQPLQIHLLADFRSEQTCGLESQSSGQQDAWSITSSCTGNWPPALHVETGSPIGRARMSTQRIKNVTNEAQGVTVLRAAQVAQPMGVQLFPWFSEICLRPGLPAG